MKIYLTFDYELYFGERTGSAQRCIIEPTEWLMQITDKFSIKTTQFVDCGYLTALNRFEENNNKVKKEKELIYTQLTKLAAGGHDLQLHIHPHWEDCTHDGDKWISNTKRYRLHVFSEEEIKEIVDRYKSLLGQFINTENIFVYRAGGWCIQPFFKIKTALTQAGIRVDSTVYHGGHFSSEIYDYDFRKAPDKPRYRFTDDPVIEDTNGFFTEMPITSIINSPLFYWKLFLLGRLDPHQHKPLGDGIPVPAPGYRKKLLSRYTVNTVSLDGYNAALLKTSLKQLRKKGHDEMVIIGHPKALTRFGAAALERFISDHIDEVTFTTFNEQKNTFL